MKIRTPSTIGWIVIFLAGLYVVSGIQIARELGVLR